VIKNRNIALAFRLGALLFALAGLMKQIGMFGGIFSLRAFMYYTIQSNLLAVVLFALLSVRTLKSPQGDAGGGVFCHTRFRMVCAVDLLVTMVVFWVLLVPRVDAAYLWTFENIAVHTVTPLLCLADYALFSRPGSLKYRDVYYVCIFPFCYVVFTSVAGVAGYVYRYEGITGGSFSGAAPTVPVRFPYFFIDFDRLGMTVLLYIGGLLAFFLLISHGIYWVDRMVYKRQNISKYD